MAFTTPRRRAAKRTAELLMLVAKTQEQARRAQEFAAHVNKIAEQVRAVQAATPVGQIPQYPSNYTAPATFTAGQVLTARHFNVPFSGWTPLSSRGSWASIGSAELEELEPAPVGWHGGHRLPTNQPQQGADNESLPPTEGP